MAGVATPIPASKLKCQVCGHIWVPRTDRLPAVCPRCKHYDWNRSPWDTEKSLKLKEEKNEVKAQAGAPATKPRVKIDLKAKLQKTKKRRSIKQ